MLITKETDYAVRCILYLARKKGHRTVVDEIAKHMLIPKHYLAKILQRLVRAGFVESTRGVGGGYTLLKPAGKLSLLDIMVVIQGTAPINVCALDRRSCRLSSSCSVHPVWVEIRRDVEKRLRRETIGRLITRGKSASVMKSGVR